MNINNIIIINQKIIIYDYNDNPYDHYEQLDMLGTGTNSKKYKLESVDQLDRIHSRIDILFKDNVISRIKEQTIFRDESLINMAKESLKKYIELNKNTT